MLVDRASRLTRRATRVGGAAIPGALLVVATLDLAACGGGSSSDEKKASEAYADNVCGAISSWKQEIKSIATDFSGEISKASLQSQITKAESGTKQLVSDIKAVPPPDTSEGQAAKQQLDQLSEDVTTNVGAAKTAISDLPANASASTIATAVATLVPQVQNLADQAKSALTTLKNAGGSLASAFKNSSSCKSLV